MSRKSLYHNNGKLAWSGSSAYDDNGKYIGKDGIKISLGTGISVETDSNTFKVKVYGRIVFKK